jgi:predicted nucleotidyltransferase
MFKKMNINGTELDLLIFMAQHPETEWHVRALAKVTHISVGSSSQCLRDLEHRGLVHSKRIGNLVQYHIAEEKPLIRSFKTFLNLLALEPIVEELKGHSERIYLFGSAADGADGERSDIDLLVVTNEKELVKRRLADLKHVNGRRLGPIVVTPAELVRLSRSNKAFHDRATDGLVLWRSEHE